MPTLLSPTSGSASRSYTPLADEVNPPYGTHAPTVTRNGTVVYGKRTSSSGSIASDDTSPHAMHHATDDARRYSPNGHVEIYRNGSDDTVSTTTSAKGKERAVMGLADDDGEGDIGELRRGGTVRASAFSNGSGNGSGATRDNGKGKGKERAWDAEMGPVEVMAESYPPGGEAQEDERRIQDNLAKFAARDMARRRAARLSKQVTPSSPNPAAQPTSPTSSSSTSSFMRRPFSIISNISTGENKRGSVMGLMGTFIGGGGAAGRDELPLSSPTRPNMSINPYDPPPRNLSPAPRMVSPTSPTFHQPSPFADPPSSPRAPINPPDFRRDSIASSSTSPPIQSPVDGAGFTYGYAGAGWRGGAGAGAGGGAAEVPKQPRGERWWHALCSWGADLDGGHDDQNEGRNQAGRTNPFE